MTNKLTPIRAALATPPGLSKQGAAACKTLREYRYNILRIQQKVISKRLGVSQGIVSMIENGKLPAPWNRKALMKAYNLSYEELERLILGAR